MIFLVPRLLLGVETIPQLKNVTQDAATKSNQAPVPGFGVDSHRYGLTPLVMGANPEMVAQVKRAARPSQFFTPANNAPGLSRNKRAFDFQGRTRPLFLRGDITPTGITQNREHASS